MSLMDLIQSASTRLRLSRQAGKAQDALESASQKDRESEGKLRRFDIEKQTIDETLTRLRDHGALFD